ncbi:very short patch repair endonuclease [Streptosporangium sp. CA-135522]|uniref:very short patch repair endonuclease n=1 Tax=Streptosporangium sp. CA-135522 TaxID=3240072 RepID=UPI003D89B63F
MTDDRSWEPTEKGAHLRGRRTRNTRPEVELRRAVHALGLRFRLHRRLVARCTPDFVLPRWQLAVFVDGCFWHGCPNHSPAEFKGPNAKRWRLKIDTNRGRDARNNTLLTEAGWRVLRIWECEIKHDLQRAAHRVEQEARGVEYSGQQSVDAPGRPS